MASSYVDFYTILAELKDKDAKFDGKTLKKLPYSQLDLAAIGNAGQCRCSPSLVIKEKAARRKPYAVVEIELEEQEREYLERTGMLSDVMDDRVMALPHLKWEELSYLAKLWFKLNCLNIHLDAPTQRLTEVVDLLTECRRADILPSQIVTSLRTEFNSVILRQGKLSDEVIRSICEQCANVVYGFLEAEEAMICDQKLLADYSCSCYCFRAIHEY